MIQSSIIGIHNFNVFRCDVGRGGGVCIYVKDSLNARIIETNVIKNADVEDIWVTVQCRKLPSVIIGAVYRHPHALVSSFDYILDIFKDICSRNRSLVVLGDINDNLLDENAKLHTITKRLGLHSCIKNPTRITEVSQSLVDVIITNKAEFILESGVTPCPVADHELVYAIINVSKPKRKPEYRTYRCLSNYNPNTFCNSILEQTTYLNTILNTDDVNAQVNTIKDVLSSSMTACAPIVTKMITRPPAPWMNETLKLSIHERNILQNQLKLDRSNIALQQEYKNKKRTVRSSIHKTRTKYFKDEFQKCNNDKTKMWKVVKRLIPNSSKISRTPQFEDVTNKVEEFNKFFSEVGVTTYRKTQESITDTENVTYIERNEPDQNVNLDLIQ